MRKLSGMIKTQKGIKSNSLAIIHVLDSQWLQPLSLATK